MAQYAGALPAALKGSQGMCLDRPQIQSWPSRWTTPSRPPQVQLRPVQSSTYLPSSVQKDWLYFEQLRQEEFWLSWCWLGDWWSPLYPAPAPHAQSCCTMHNAHTVMLSDIFRSKIALTDYWPNLQQMQQEEILLCRWWLGDWWSPHAQHHQLVQSTFVLHAYKRGN